MYILICTCSLSNSATVRLIVKNFNATLLISWHSFILSYRVLILPFRVCILFWRALILSYHAWVFSIFILQVLYPPINDTNSKLYYHCKIEKSKTNRYRYQSLCNFWNLRTDFKTVSLTNDLQSIEEICIDKRIHKTLYFIVIWYTW